MLVTSTDNLGTSTTGRLLDRTREALLVLTAPGPGVTGSLGVEAGGASSSDDPRPAECVGSELVDLLEDLEVRTEVGAEYPAPSGCFYGDNGALVAQPRDGVVLLGAVDVLRNGGILEADNAAVALRLLGQHERLVWYVPDVADLAADDAVTLSSLLPDWLRPGLWLVALALLALVIWRGRRLGALATEPLPVVVRAIETTRSRGRLYRRADDRAHAAATLRSAARAAAADRLRLPAGVPEPESPDALVRDVARHLGRPVGDVAALLHPHAPAPTTDHDLITLANALAGLDGGTPSMSTTPQEAPTDANQAVRERLGAVRTEVAKAVVGQEAAVSGLRSSALLCGGHVLMERGAGGGQDPARAHPGRRPRRAHPARAVSLPT